MGLLTPSGRILRPRTAQPRSEPKSTKTLADDLTRRGPALPSSLGMSASRQALGTVPAAAANAASPPPGLEDLDDHYKYEIELGNVWLRIELTDPLASATEYCVTESFLRAVRHPCHKSVPRWLLANSFGPDASDRPGSFASQHPLPFPGRWALGVPRTQIQGESDLMELQLFPIWQPVSLQIQNINKNHLQRTTS